ncbi:MAG: bifunctional 3'-5' exonuclease/DNA polymerase [Microbacteriaceae bacterium]|nr:bifunctional 3'-5' exonuclease/DNA polymerase [Microbacteriaceae bacterium]
MDIVLGRSNRGVLLWQLDANGQMVIEPQLVTSLEQEVARREAGPMSPRWVWDDTSRWYPELIRAGVRVRRCVDLRLSRAIIRRSPLTAETPMARAAFASWDQPTPEPRSPVGAPSAGTLFDWEPETADDPTVEFFEQLAAIEGATDPARLRLLLAAESAGSLIAAEMKFAGLPWRADLHEALLTDTLGSRPRSGERPAKMQQILEVVRTALGAPDLNPDSPTELLRALKLAGIEAASTRSWELQNIDHPAIAPLLDYKKRARILSSNGWNWLETNVISGRFHPDYVPGGVVTGRWASKGGGGALQLPKQVRGAVVADPGWVLVVADAAQLEPRILSALASDRAMAEAGQAGDLYAGIVASGAVDTREQAKLAMLGAMYGATSGEAGRLLPRLAKSFPRAIALVEEAARAGERGEVVSTRLGRGSPRGAVPGWDETSTVAEKERVRAQAKSWGRFTRNFVVQGSAAEWALCWMAGVRQRVFELGDSAPSRAGANAGASWLRNSPHLVFFLHDEVVVHCPLDLAASVETALRAAAVDAGRLLFGQLPVSFPISVAAVASYADAK